MCSTQYWQNFLPPFLPGRSNIRVEALGGCGVSTFAKQQTKMRVKKLEKRAD